MSDGPTLVTGATGFVGGHLLDRLAHQNDLVAWHRPDGSEPDPARTVDWHAVDITDRHSVMDAVQAVTPVRVFHLAGAPNVATSWQSVVPHLRANALGTHYLLRAIRQLERPCRVLVISSAQVYKAGDGPLNEESPLVPASPYGFSKLAQDQLALLAAQDDGLDVLVARPFNHAGPGQAPGFAISSFACQIARIEAGLAEPLIRVGNLDARRDVTDVRDVVDAYARLMEGGIPGRPYNVCSGRAWRIGDLLDAMLRAARTPIAVEVDAAQFRPNDTPVVQGDATRIRDELGWAPTIPVEQTLIDTLNWWRGRTTAA
jgi:GDP-4-dehydro-6-deoxy-D-mannose reductase